MKPEAFSYQTIVQLTAFLWMDMGAMTKMMAVVNIFTVHNIVITIVSRVSSQGRQTNQIASSYWIHPNCHSHHQNLTINNSFL
jgi:hypothetical protein